MRKKRIAIDMDDVMAFTVKKIVDRYENEYGYRLTDEDLAGKLVEDAVPTEHRSVVLNWIHTPGFYTDLPVMTDAQHVVFELTKVYEVFIVSAANAIPSSVPEKLGWLKRHFDFISWQNTVFCGYKSIVNADYMIDDHPKNLAVFEGEGLLFEAHHNVFNRQFKRVNGWREVEDILLD